jgi:hypothetical protein
MPAARQGSCGPSGYHSGFFEIETATAQVECRQMDGLEDTPILRRRERRVLRHVDQAHSDRRELRLAAC